MSIDTYAANEAYRAYTQATCGITAPKIEGTVIEQAHAAITHASEMFEQFLNRIDAEKLSPEGLRDTVAQFTRTDVAKAVDTAVANVRERRDQAAAAIERLRREMSPAGDAAAELRNTRYWNRTIRRLDNTKPADLFSVANDLLSNANREELGVLVQELPAYLESQGSTSDWIDAKLGELMPDYRRARQELTNAQKAVQITDYNSKQLPELFASAVPTTYREPIFADARNYDPDR